MKIYTLIIFIFSFSLVQAQGDCLENNTYIAMSDTETYVKQEIMSFADRNKVMINNLKTNSKKNYNYNLIQEHLIINDRDWGEVKCYDEYFLLILKMKDSLQYNKLIATKINCNKKELAEIINSSKWEYNLKNEKGRIHITNLASQNTSLLNNELIKINDTYLINSEVNWFTIGSISKNKIEVYGLVKFNNIPKKVVLHRIKS